MPESSPPVDHSGAPVTVTLGHMSPTTRALMLVAMILGVGGGGWNVIAQTMPAAPPKAPPGMEARVDRAEMAVMENKIAIQKLNQTDEKIRVKLKQMATRMSILMQIAAANYAASTLNSPSRRDAARIAADKIKQDTGAFLESKDPLHLLGGSASP